MHGYGSSTTAHGKFVRLLPGVIHTSPILRMTQQIEIIARLIFSLLRLYDGVEACLTLSHCRGKHALASAVFSGNLCLCGAVS